MERYSERRVLDLYRVALANHDILGKHYVPTLKNIFSRKEWSLMKEACSTNKALALEVVRRVQHKDTVPCYLDFSKAVFSDESVRSNAEAYLPFARNFHATRTTPRESETVLPIPPSSPLAVWLLTSEDQYKHAENLLRKQDDTACSKSDECKPAYTACGGGVSCGIKYQVFNDSSSKTFAICLATVQGNAIFTVSHFLNSVRPKPLLTLLTSTCSAPLLVARGGDVVIVSRRKETLTIPAELECAMALWRLEKTEKWRKRCVSPTADEKSIYLQALWLARLYAELTSLPEDRTPWFQELNLDLDSDMDVTESVAFAQNIPNPDQLWKVLKTSASWSYSDSSGPLPYTPSGQLLAMARASMLHSPCCFPPPPNRGPQVVVSHGAKRFLTEGAKVVCSPETTGFYQQPPKTDYIAIMGVSHTSIDCDEYDSGEVVASQNAIAFAIQALEHMARRRIPQ